MPASVTLSLSCQARAPADDPAAVAPELAAQPTLPQGSTAALARGREVFVANCTKCHVEGLGDAPVVTDAEAWSARLSQPAAALYAHAIEGFWGDVGEMPPRGDNDALSDAEVRAAVDYIRFVQSDAATR